MEYKVLMGSLDEKEEFEANVTEYLSRGWEPAGGIALLKLRGDEEVMLALSQAIVRK